MKDIRQSSNEVIVNPDYSSIMGNVGSGQVWGSNFYAPYSFIPVKTDFSFAQMSNITDTKYFVLCFIVNATDDPNLIKPAWDSEYSLIDPLLATKIKELRDQGGDIMMSFGGASGLPLQACNLNEISLADIYWDLIVAYDLTMVDFDIEGPFSYVSKSDVHEYNILNAKALKIVQDRAIENNRHLELWLTLPVAPSGLTSDGYIIYNDYVMHGVNVNVNLMTMDFYGWIAATKGETLMADYSIDAVEIVKLQIKEINEAFGIKLTDANIYGMMGATPMIGQNDAVDNIFFHEDAYKIVDFAKSNNLRRLSQWSTSRDVVFDHYDPVSNNTSPGIPNEENQFSIILNSLEI